MDINEDFVLKSVLQDKEEKIVNQFKVTKYNKKFIAQERNLILTNKNLYNIRNKNFLTNAINLITNKLNIKRKIKIIKIDLIFYSLKSDQILICIPNKFDYLWEFKERDNFIINLFFCLELMEKKEIKFIFTEEFDLTKYTNHKSLIKKGIIKPHPENFINIDKKSFESFINEKNNLNNSNIIETNNTIKLNNFNINNIKKINIIGQGGFGIVYLVEMENKFYALKEIQKKLIIKNNFFKQIKTEIEVLKKIDHPFLINLVKFFQTDYKIYFLMPYIPNGNLLNLIKNKGSFSENEVLFYVIQIVDALEFLQENNIIYGDLKPENILIDEKGYIKLCDFGASIFFDKNNTDTTHIGTKDYIAPEHISNSKYLKNIDLYALGILIYKLLLGNTPFKDMELNEVFYKKINEDIIIPDSIWISEECKNFIENCLKKDPKKRFDNIQINLIKNHKWLKNINLIDIKNYKIKSPYIPEKIQIRKDSKNIEKEGEPTKELIKEHQNKFSLFK